MLFFFLDTVSLFLGVVFLLVVFLLGCRCLPVFLQLCVGFNWDRGAGGAGGAGEAGGAGGAGGARGADVHAIAGALNGLSFTSLGNGTSVVWSVGPLEEQIPIVYIWLQPRQGVLPTKQPE